MYLMYFNISICRSAAIDPINNILDHAATTTDRSRAAPRFDPTGGRPQNRPTRKAARREVVPLAKPCPSRESGLFSLNRVPLAIPAILPANQVFLHQIGFPLVRPFLCPSPPVYPRCHPLPDAGGGGAISLPLTGRGGVSPLGIRSRVS